MTNAYTLADLARELTRFGHDLRVLTTTPHYNLVADDLRWQPMTPAKGQWLLQSDFEGIPCFHVRVPPVKGGMGRRIKTALRFHTLGLMAAMGKAWDCDIVISQSPPLSIGLVGSWIARRHGAKAVYIVQDVFPDGLIRQGKIRNPALIALLRALERAVYRRSDAVCAISPGIAEVLRPRLPASTRLEVIPNFVNTDVYHPLPRDNDFSRAHGLTDRFVVSYVGNIGNAQDFSPVLATARACRDLPITILMVGDGIKRAALEAEAAIESLTNIVFLGYQPREVTPWINASSDVSLVLLAPHVGNYGFPSKIYTLMASGKPVLLLGDPASDIGRFVSEQWIGWVVPSGDAEAFVATVQCLYAARDTLAPYGERGVRAVEQQFTLPRVAERYDELIRTLVGC